MYIRALSMPFYTNWVAPNSGSITAHTVYNRFSFGSSWLVLIKFKYEIICQCILWLSSHLSIFSWLWLSCSSNTIPTIEPKFELNTQLILVLFCGITPENSSPHCGIDSWGGTSCRCFSGQRLPYQAKVRQKKRIGCIYILWAIEPVHSPCW